MKKLSRNDLCWCNSGKKYKACHLENDTKLKEFKYKGYPVPSNRLIRNEEEIANIRKCADITRGILELLETEIKAGMRTIEIDKFVYDYTVSKGAIPATIGYHGYKHSCCVSINNVICHGIPGEIQLKDGDIVNVDIAINLDGFYSDASRMYMVGNVSEEAKKIVECAKECLNRAIEAVKPYEPISVVAAAIEPYAKKLGYSVVRDFTGHGIGVNSHDDPYVFHFVSNEKEMIMVPGMVFTIEPMINENGHGTKILSDGWTVTTIDGGLSAQWEHTILVTEDGTEILT